MVKCVIMVHHRRKVSNLIQQFPTSRCFWSFHKNTFLQLVVFSFFDLIFFNIIFKYVIVDRLIAIPSSLTTVLSSLKKGDCLYFSENDSHDIHCKHMFARHYIFTPILASTLWHCRFVSQSDSINISTRRAMDLEDSIFHAPHFNIALFYCFSWSYSFRTVSSKLLRLIMKPLWKYFIVISIHSRFSTSTYLWITKDLHEIFLNQLNNKKALYNTNKQ